MPEEEKKDEEEEDDKEMPESDVLGWLQCDAKCAKYQRMLRNEEAYEARL